MEHAVDRLVHHRRVPAAGVPGFSARSRTFGYCLGLASAPRVCAQFLGFFLADVTHPRQELRVVLESVLELAESGIGFGFGRWSLELVECLSLASHRHSLTCALQSVSSLASCLDSLQVDFLESPKLAGLISASDGAL